MPYLQLAYLHLITVVPAFLIGTLLIFSKRKGSLTHKLLGRIYLALMLITALISLFMPAALGPTLLGRFGWIHLLSIVTLITVFAAYFNARNGNIKTHRNQMLGLYFGGIILAGSFAFLPGRMLHGWLSAIVTV